MNNGKAEWPVHLNMDDRGNVIYEPRHDPKHKRIIAANMTGKPFSAAWALRIPATSLRICDSA
jgi:hypothetical protein